MSEARRKVVYIMSDNRSGSTLLDQLLGASRQVCSIGEVHHLAAYALQSEELFDTQQPLECACGQALSRCRFWTEVESHLGQPLHSLKLHLRIRGAMPESSSLNAVVRRIVRRYLEQSPRRFGRWPIPGLLNSQRIAVDSFTLFDAIFATTHVDYIVDSSKGAYRFRSLFDYKPDRVAVILLTRDYRATVNSKMKRGRSLTSSINGWVARMNEMVALSDDVPSDQLFHLRYEDLCAQPEDVMRRIARFLDIDYSDAMLTRPSSDIHSLGGSPSKSDPKKREIRLDRSFEDAFSADELAKMKSIAGEVAARWGYD